MADNGSQPAIVALASTEPPSTTRMTFFALVLMSALRALCSRWWGPNTAAARRVARRVLQIKFLQPASLRWLRASPAVAMSGLSDAQLQLFESLKAKKKAGSITKPEKKLFKVLKGLKATVSTATPSRKRKSSDCAAGDGPSKKQKEAGPSVEALEKAMKAARKAWKANKSDKALRKVFKTAKKALATAQKQAASAAPDAAPAAAGASADMSALLDVEIPAEHRGNPKVCGLAIM